jgi:hypothetical protein
MPICTHHPFASLQVKAILQRSNDARDSLEQAVEEMKREIIVASATSIERTALQDEVLPPTLLNSSIIAVAEHFHRLCWLPKPSHVADTIASRPASAGVVRSQAAAAAVQ